MNVASHCGDRADIWPGEVHSLSNVHESLPVSTVSFDESKVFITVWKATCSGGSIVKFGGVSPTANRSYSHFETLGGKEGLASTF